MNKIYMLLLVLGLLPRFLAAQTTIATPVPGKSKDLVYKLNEEGTQWVKLTFLNQIWIRYNESNPGTTVYGSPKAYSWDVGLRRTRIQLFGQVSDRVFVYTQFGQNNLAYNSPRKLGLFFLDAIGEYKVAGESLSLGAGLTGWSGLSRYASPSVGSILTLDAPLYQQATNDVTDQFLRKLSVYAKGKIGHLDYRVSVSDPMSIQNSTAQAAIISDNALFSAEPGKAQYQGYFMYQFLDKESNMTPYNTGTYLGKKQVFNIGAGFIEQKNAMWHLANSGTDTVRSNLMLLAVDVFYDAPINPEKGNAVTAYASYSHNDYGKNYVRNIGAMNPANGTSAGGSLNGAGNAFPVIGTGSTFYGQVGYLFRKDLLGDSGTLQPFAATQVSKFKLLKDPMLMYEAGFNWLMEGQRAKLSLEYQSRPVFTSNGAGGYVANNRRGMAVMQFQVSL